MGHSHRPVGGKKKRMGLLLCDPLARTRESFLLLLSSLSIQREESGVQYTMINFGPDFCFVEHSCPMMKI